MDELIDDDVPITFVDESFVLVSNFCKISYENLRKSLDSGDIDISYLSLVQQNEHSENCYGEDGEGESTGSDATDGDETEESSDEQLSSNFESDAELMSEEVNDSEEVDSEVDQPGPGTCRTISKPRPEVAKPPFKSKGKAGKGSKRAKVGPQASSKGTTKKNNGSKSRKRRSTKHLSQEQLEDICTSIEEKESKILDIDDCIKHLRSSRSLAFIEKRSLMVKLLTAENNKESLAELIKFMLNQIKLSFLECGKKKLSSKDKRAVFAHTCSQDMLLYNEASKPHFVVWERLMKSTSCESLTRSVQDEGAIRTVLYWYLYETFHGAVLLSKDQDFESFDKVTVAMKEDEVTLYRFSGAALHRMIKLREETIRSKKGRRTVTEESKEKMIMELDILLNLRMPESQKSSLPKALQLLDEGGLVFFKSELLPVIQEIDMRTREFLNPQNAEKFPSTLLKVTQQMVFKNVELEKLFIEKVNSVLEEEPNSDVLKRIFDDLVTKIVNTRTKEFMLAWRERQGKTTGKAVDTDQSLRDKLKTFSSMQRR